MKENIFNWLNQLNETEVIPSNIIAMNFGIFESENEYMLYLVGSENYDETDDDWASEIDYEPKNKYVKIHDSEKNDWEQIQNEIEVILNEFISSKDFVDSIFSKVNNITVGFDDGDLTKIK